MTPRRRDVTRTMFKHWADGGPTNADNLALLCHRHHILLHEGGYHLQCHGDSWVVLRPDGTRLHQPLAAALGDIGSSGLSVRDSIGFYSAGVDSPVDRPNRCRLGVRCSEAAQQTARRQRVRGS